MLSKPKIVLVLFVALMSATLYYLFRPGTTAPYTAISMQDPTLPPQDIDWKEYISEKPAFKVLLPTTPQHAEESVPLPAAQGVMKYDLYLSQSKSGATFMISVIEYPEGYDMSNQQSLLDGVQKEMLSGNEKNKLVDSSKGMFQSCLSLDFLLENPDIVTKSKAFIHGRRLYVLTVVDRVKEHLESHFTQFTNSFEVS